MRMKRPFEYIKTIQYLYISKCLDFVWNIDYEDQAQVYPLADGVVYKVKETTNCGDKIFINYSNKEKFLNTFTINDC